ncbi:hypothetical protein A0H81_14598 [Grifola frondosa]|uniref:Uncharacterized protein n=1 Tax=Grifola frondosa TaxID=5627 RepID=A0A1C7LMQ7_GRIFR|nr:hypothetical protein A0H81_14598 [Grifola frondosa]
MPSSFGGPYMSIVNNSGHLANIGIDMSNLLHTSDAELTITANCYITGFITNLGLATEEMNTALMFKEVGDGLSVTVNFTPILKAYVGCDYEQGQVVDADIQGVQPVWEANLLSLQESTVVSIVRKGGGGYKATQLG